MISNLFAALALLGSIGVGLIAVTLMTQATFGVGCMAGACLLGILARIFQADCHANKLTKEHKEIMEAIKARPK